MTKEAMQTSELHTRNIAELAAGLRSGEFTSVELTRHFLNRIQKLDGTYNSFITVTTEQALAQAAEADKRLTEGNAPPLCGIPIAHKDLFCTAGVRTSCGSKMLDNFVPPYSATVVENLKAVGAVMLGKTNMDEFAMGSSNENSFYGPVKNPWDTSRVPGGSSGGSAAAVAAQLVPAATASDTGGSIRQPAALCGLTGIKPTYGQISRYGMVAFASSLDQAGIMAHSAEDAAIMLSALASYDPKDSTSVDRKVPDYLKEIGAASDKDLTGLKIGVPEEYFSAGLNPDTEQVVRKALAEYEKLGAKIVNINLPHTELAVPTYYVIAPAEASANLSRFDGVRYGYRCEAPKDLQDLYTRSRAEGFGEEVKQRILVGTYALSAGYYDAYYKKAQQVRRLIRQDFIDAFKKVDLIMGPTCPSTAFKLGEKSNDPIAMYLEDIYTLSTNLAGLPGLSIPAGFAPSPDGNPLPIGLQIIGNYFDEARMLKVAHRFQQVTDWHRATAKGVQA